MTLRTGNWELDLIVAVSLAAVLVSCWLVVATHRTTQAARRKHLVGLERELLILPLAGAVFRLAQALAFLLFALDLFAVRRPGEYALVTLYVLALVTMPLHSLLLLRRQRQTLRKIPPAVPKEDPHANAR